MNEINIDPLIFNKTNEVKINGEIYIKKDFNNNLRKQQMANEVIELNPNKQYILCGDISASMQATDDKCGGQQRYGYMVEKFKQFIKEAEDFDADGPTIFMFGEKVHQYLNTTLEKVEKHLNAPKFEGFTNTHLVIHEAWAMHKAEKEALAKDGKTHSGTVVFVFTDGDPTNRLALERTIRDIANTVDNDEEFSIGFILVGSIAPELKAYLDKLDDDLKAKFDIVGVNEIEGLSFLKAVHTAIHE